MKLLIILLILEKAVGILTGILIEMAGTIDLLIYRIRMAEYIRLF